MPNGRAQLTNDLSYSNLEIQDWKKCGEEGAGDIKCLDKGRDLHGTIMMDEMIHNIN